MSQFDKFIVFFFLFQVVRSNYQNKSVPESFTGTCRQVLSSKKHESCAFRSKRTVSSGVIPPVRDLNKNAN